MSGLEAVVGLSALASALVFAIAFRVGLRDARRREAAEIQLPRAVIASGDPRWLSGQRRQRWLGRVPAVQAAFVAMAVTSIFVMSLCLAAMVAVAISSL